jgi:Uncharacterized protein conserved in bacteria (DUF2066)
MRNEARSRPWWRHAFMLVLALLTVPGTARAADMYRIEGVTVDATGESGVAARDLAIAAGQREGLTRMMQRLTSPTAHRYLPDVAAVPIERYVNSFEIAEEKVGPTRYLATLNISYVAEEVQALLDAADIPYVTRRSDPILVVPVELAPEGAAVPWPEASPWRAAWYDGLEQATVTVLALPLGDLADMAAAPPAAVAAGDRPALDALAGRYGTPTVVVASATLERAPGTGELQRVTVGARRADAWAQPLLETTVEPAPEEDEAQTLSRAVGLVIAAIEEDWTRETLVDLGPASALPVAVPLADLRGWVQIRDELTGLPEVRAVDVETFAQDEARVLIGYRGGLDELMAAVERVGLSLALESDGWRLRPAGGPAAYRAPSPVLPATP